MRLQSGNSIFNPFRSMNYTFLPSVDFLLLLKSHVNPALAWQPIMHIMHIIVYFKIHVIIVYISEISD